MRVLISIDMEGVAGDDDGADVTPGEDEYQRNRARLTEEANAAARGVFAFDPAAEVAVTEAHAIFRNLLPDQLDRRVRLIRGRPKAGGMMAGLTDDTDAVVFVGYHAKAGTPDAVLAHTKSSLVVRDVRCNGRSLGEIGLNAAFAAHHGSTPVLISGDDKAVAEARQVISGVHSVQVKRALGNFAADCLHPARVCELLETGVAAALADRADIHPLRLDGPVDLEVDVHKPAQAEVAGLLVPGVERVGGTTLRYLAADFAAAYRMAELIVFLGR